MAYNEKYLADIVALFFTAIHAIKTEYSLEQINAWGNLARKNDLKVKWREELLRTHTIIAIENQRVTGFSNIDHNGYIDLMYVHPEYQHQGIGTFLLGELEYYAQTMGMTTLTVEASIVAKKLFQNVGFISEEKQSVTRDGVSLDNFKMYKILN